MGFKRMVCDGMAVGLQIITCFILTGICRRLHRLDKQVWQNFRVSNIVYFMSNRKLKVTIVQI